MLFHRSYHLSLSLTILHVIPVFMLMAERLLHGIVWIVIPHANTTGRSLGGHGKVSEELRVFGHGIEIRVFGHGVERRVKGRGCGCIPSWNLGRRWKGWMEVICGISLVGFAGQIIRHPSKLTMPGSVLTSMWLSASRPSSWDC